jgi:hypothetical protein
MNGCTRPPRESIVTIRDVLLPSPGAPCAPWFESEANSVPP